MAYKMAIACLAPLMAHTLEGVECVPIFPHGRKGSMHSTFTAAFDNWFRLLFWSPIASHMDNGNRLTHSMLCAALGIDEDGNRPVSTSEEASALSDGGRAAAGGGTQNVNGRGGNGGAAADGR